MLIKSNNHLEYLQLMADTLRQLQSYMALNRTENKKEEMLLNHAYNNIREVIRLEKKKQAKRTREARILQ